MNSLAGRSPLPAQYGMLEGMVKTSPEFCATRLKTLADDTRLAVVRVLMQGPQHVGELMQALNVEQSLLSHHLRILREAKIVSAQRDGKSVLYSLTPRVVGKPELGAALDLGCCQLSFD